MINQDAFVFYFFERGSGMHTIDFDTYELDDFHVHILFPKQIDILNAKECEGHKLIVNQTFANQYLYEAQFLTNPTNLFPVLEFDRAAFFQLLLDLLLLMSILLELDNTGLQMGVLRASIITKTLDLYIEEQVQENNGTLAGKRTHPILEQFTLLIEQHYHIEKSVGFYADILCVTPNYLSVLCRKFWGTNAKELIYSRVVQEAKRKLIMDHISIKEVAYLLGFFDTSHFSGFIKQKTGFSPKQLRNKDL
jgi:AraC-type DNA-binding domain-containing proteins